ncbi:hypothetical protein CY34DRAFT_429237 [Suillus luteus UH-Slu-Lm8-n1]|uniref:Uncharacterized protein n=1 Tax=Suillus luteus UH-Slu-Lm8-n1 TaxID=930992 RepID=A0A0D0B4L1_9AGAM|nr:hypothetical protein CY34DRAFT_429237 [Suillus luteus UH-Slu-Lm8-n1]
MRGQDTAPSKFSLFMLPNVITTFSSRRPCKLSLNRSRHPSCLRLRDNSRRVATAIILTRHIHVLFTETDLKPDNILFNEANTMQTGLELLVQSHEIIRGELELRGGPTHKGSKLGASKVFI